MSADTRPLALRLAADFARRAVMHRAINGGPHDPSDWRLQTAVELTRLARVEQDLAEAAKTVEFANRVNRLDQARFEAVLRERDELRSEVEQLLRDARDDEIGREVMGDLLARTANAIRGEPAPMCRHSWHDLPERAGAAMAALAGALQAAKTAAIEVERLRAAPAPVALTPAQQHAEELAAVLKAGRNDLALAAASWNEDENRQVADFHRKRVMALIERTDAVIASIEVAVQEGGAA